MNTEKQWRSRSGVSDVTPPKAPNTPEQQTKIRAESIRRNLADKRYVAMTVELELARIKAHARGRFMPAKPF
jgi:hypothetical protein